MPKVSINILTKDRAELLRRALESVLSQNFIDYEIVIVNDGSADNTAEILNSKFKILNKSQIINHKNSKGITISRQEALEASRGEYVAVLDDDDEWTDKDKLKRQVNFFDSHQNTVLIGGAIQISNLKFQISKQVQNPKSQTIITRPQGDREIRKTMLLRNNFFTSTVMFRREAALAAGGFVNGQDDLAEDYDLWLRLGEKGQMYNFQEVLTSYKESPYSREKFKKFLKKQRRLIRLHRNSYPHYQLSRCLLTARIIL